ncbi:hypothetical protein [Dyadobacter sp. 676]|uniref:Uncharacterized protein n=1 Tax=Dyadobacter sp. 676 TaxID=3088362 RepID=A0AAU8FC71_9BACT
MKKNVIIVLCLLSSVFVTCKDDEPFEFECTDGVLNFELLNDELNPQVRLKEVGTSSINSQIIQNENELYKKLEIVFLKKKIDFDKKSLVVISFKTNPPVSVESQVVVADCNNNRIQVTAELRSASIPVDAVNCVFAIVPKLKSYTIEFVPKYIK